MFWLDRHILYMLDGKVLHSRHDMEFLKNYPLIRYASRNWLAHQRLIVDKDEGFEELLLGLFLGPLDIFTSWIELIMRVGRLPYALHSWASRMQSRQPSPMAISASLGLTSITLALIKDRAERKSVKDNAFFRELEFALSHAIMFDRKNTVRSLLFQYKVMGVPKRVYNAVLLNTMTHGSTGIDRLLLDHGVDVTGDTDEEDDAFAQKLAYLDEHMDIMLLSAQLKE